MVHLGGHPDEERDDEGGRTTRGRTRNQGPGTKDDEYETSSMNRDITKAQEQLFAPGTSGAAKYSALVVGLPGFGALLKYELVVTLAQARTGAMGLALRKALYPWSSAPAGGT